MLLPALLPEQYSTYASAESDTKLFEMLANNPTDMVIFFEYACDHETWSEEHAEFMRSAITWFTERTLKDRLSSESITYVVGCIQMHYHILKQYVPLNITFSVEGHEVAANSLLWSARSDYFHLIINRSYNEKNQSTIEVKEVPFDLFIIMDEFVQFGKVSALWKRSHEEIMTLLRFATAFRLHGLMEQCEDTLKRYLNRNNVFSTLIMAHGEGWRFLEGHCCQFINDLSIGVILSIVEEKNLKDMRPLAIEFLSFIVPALDAFEQLKKLITHLICSGRLTQDPEFSRVLKSCPRLFSVDISRSVSFSEQLFNLPANLQELDLSSCVWLSNANLQQIIEACPNLTRILLSSNVQINFNGWALLQKLRWLSALDVSRCTQINDEDLRLILKACRSVTELNLEECKRLTPTAFFEMARSMPQLAVLNVARCNITDAVLIEISVRCRNLRSLEITRCKDVSEKGILQVLREATVLQELGVKFCRISEAGIAKIKQMRPLLVFK